MAWGYIALVVVGLIMIVSGFYFGFVYQGQRLIKNLLSVLMPLGLIVVILGIILTVLPDFFKETVW